MRKSTLLGMLVGLGAGLVVVRLWYPDSAWWLVLACGFSCGWVFREVSRLVLYFRICQVVETEYVFVTGPDTVTLSLVNAVFSGDEKRIRNVLFNCCPSDGDVHRMSKYALLIKLYSASLFRFRPVAGFKRIRGLFFPGLCKHEWEYISGEFILNSRWGVADGQGPEPTHFSTCRSICRWCGKKER